MRELLDINIPDHTFTYRVDGGEPITEDLTKMPDYAAFVNGATKDFVVIR